MSGDEDLRKGKEKLRQDFEDKHQTFGIITMKSPKENSRTINLIILANG